jgi:hypothetical protein
MKPYLHPLRSATGKIVTRHFPMETVKGEPTDHPHQRGLWFAHDSVNGFDFWNNEANYTTPIRGRIVVDKAGSFVGAGGKTGNVGAMLSWIDPHDVKLLNESLQMTFRSDPTLRIIDFDTTLTAVTKVTFGDSIDGTFGLRIAPVLQEASSAGHGSNSALPHTGIITNAEGMEHEKAVWGKPSNWVDYSGQIDGEKLGIAIFDHPENSRRRAGMCAPTDCSRRIRSV